MIVPVGAAVFVTVPPGPTIVFVSEPPGPPQFSPIGQHPYFALSPRTQVAERGQPPLPSGQQV